jgi:DNA (cytosine-5)-methyltransferase 1
MRVLSLFSGVGGFDMGLEAAGMTTVFQCEIDKHARSVLDYHWPDTPKWDDVSTLTGAHILEVTGGVDVVAWGSPCQDLSLAGKRAGLSGERSGLFHEGIRIIKELRELSNGKYPTWSIWENVVGALSSNRGADFGEVLYEMDEAGACFSEWTVLDAQYFGVPQRRRRVFVTSCFDSATSERCGSPLFPVCESVSGDSSEGGKKGKGASRSTQDRIGTGSELASGGEVANTIPASIYHRSTVVNQDVNSGHLVIEPTTFVKSRRAQSVNDHETWVESDVTPTLNVFDIGDIRATTAIIEPVAYSIREDATANNFSATEIETARALQALQPSVQSHHAQTFITQPILLDGRRVNDVRVYTEPVQTLQERMGTGGNNVPVVAQETIIIDRAAYNQGENARYEPVIEESHTMPSLVARGPHAVGQETILLRNREGKPGGGKGPLISEDISLTLGTSNDQTLFQTGQEEVQAISYDGYNQKLWKEQHVPLRTQGDASDFIADLREPTLIVRRLTPLECERLMGWPDNHTAESTNGSVSDTQRYKMCGNGVASPVATWIAKHILANGT